MRLVTAFLLMAVPTCAAAQSPPVGSPHRPPRSAAHKPADRKPTAQKPTPHRPAARRPAPHARAPQKPVPAKPNAKPPAPAPAPAAPAAPEPDTHKGSNTGLPLPRFAALKTDDVNFRRGPGTRYPIEWVYKRRDLPVEIEREFEVWRLVADADGTKGWVHNATLTGRRTALVIGVERTLRQAPSDTAPPVAKLEQGVIVRLRSCEAKSNWCQVQVSDYRGFLKRNEIWGVLPDEVIP